jgi:hypothetical protein
MKFIQLPRNYAASTSVVLFNLDQVTVIEERSDGSLLVYVQGYNPEQNYVILAGEQVASFWEQYEAIEELNTPDA